MIYAILDDYRVLAHDYTREGLETTIKTFMSQYEDKEIVEIEDIEVGYDLAKRDFALPLNYIRAAEPSKKNIKLQREMCVGN